MLGHFTVDMYGGILPIMFPVLVDDFSLSKQSVGFIALGFTAAASLSQPFFGYLADRYGSRYFASASMVWSAIMVGMFGLAPTFGMVLLLAVLAGLGSGAYHPQGASNAARAVGERGRNSALAFYTVGGTSGFALAPVIGAVVLVLFGKGGTILLLPFGLIVAVLLWRQMTKLGLGMPGRSTVRSAGMQAIQWSPLVLVVVIVMLRSWVHSSAVNFIPLWFDEQGYSAGFYSVLQTTVLASGAAGTLSGGFLADRFGQKAVLMVSLIGAAPLLIVFAAFPGPQSFLLGPMFAFTADMSLSVTLVMAQRFLPGRIGMASGFILGIGFVTGGIGVPITGAMADRYGIGEAMMITSVLIVLAGILSVFIPRRSALPGVRAARNQPVS